MATYTYSAVGNREDLVDIITNISPEENFLQGKFGRTEVTAMQHDWLTDSLRPAAANRQLEKADFATVDATPRIRLSNYVQHMMVGYVVTDAQEKVLKAGIRSEISYQMLKASKELARDFENALLKNATQAAGAVGAGGLMGGVRFFIGGDALAVSQSGGTITVATHKLQTGQPVLFYITAGGASPTGVTCGTMYYARVLTANTFTIHPTALDAQANTNATAISSNGTNAYVTRSNILSLNTTLSEDNFNDIMEICWKQGASIETAIMSGKRKREISQWTAGTVKNRDQSENKLTTLISVYEGDFGVISLEAHRQQTDDRIDFLEYMHWKCGFLKPFAVEDVPRKGTYTEKVINGMVTLECRSPQSNGAIINIT